MHDAPLQFSLASFIGYDVCTLKGEVTVAQLPGFSPHLLKHIQANAGKHLVIDLSGVLHLDSSAIRLIVNLKKRLDENSRTLFLLAPSEPALAILKSMHLDKAISIVGTCLAIDKTIAESKYSILADCSYPEGQARRLNCTCAVCGSNKVVAYLANAADYDWSWVEDDPFPTGTPKAAAAFADYFALLPTICLDCCMCAIDPELFHIVKDGKIVLHATLDEQAKFILSKAIKRRKNLAENAGCALEETAFGLQRSPASLACAYTLAEECARAVAVGKKTAGAFAVGYVTYLALRYIDSSRKPEFINKCRTWFTQALSEHDALPTPLLARAYFILMNASLNLDKIKEAAGAYQQFSKMMETAPAETASSLESPQFWFNQAQVIWRRAIAERSKELARA